jgi:hypothetical protein
MPPYVSSSDYQALAEIRHRIRRFVNFSEASAREVGLEPQQHQVSQTSEVEGRQP